MGQPRLGLGEQGEPWVTQRPDGRWQARVRIRDLDGRVREVSAIGTGKQSARRALVTALERRNTRSRTLVVSGAMTMEALAVYWMEHRKTHGQVNRQAPVRDSTLGAYQAAIDSVLRGASAPDPRPFTGIGGIRVGELDVQRLDRLFGEMQSVGRDTRQARSVLSQMLDLAVRYDAIAANPMARVEKGRGRRTSAPASPSTAPQEGGEDLSDDLDEAALHDLLSEGLSAGVRDPHALTVAQASDLLIRVHPDSLRTPGRRGPNADLYEVTVFLLGTGCRIGEALAVRWRDLIDLNGDCPRVIIGGTLIEPRKGHVQNLHRQETTKGGRSRLLFLPPAVAEVLRERRKRVTYRRQSDPVFASRTGTWLWPNNVRTRLRAAVAGAEGLSEVTPHTLRRTVATHIIGSPKGGMDAARIQMGHADASVTGQRYEDRRLVTFPGGAEVLSDFFGGQGTAGVDRSATVS